MWNFVYTIIITTINYFLSPYSLPEQYLKLGHAISFQIDHLLNPPVIWHCRVWTTDSIIIHTFYATELVW
jgi:hypothetical protein